MQGHQWTFQEDYFCAWHYIWETLKRESIDVEMFIKYTVEVLPPEITYEMVYKKMRILKGLSMREGIHDEIPIEPLFTISKQCVDAYDMAASVVLATLDDDMAWVAPPPSRPRYDPCYLLRGRISYMEDSALDEEYPLVITEKENLLLFQRPGAEVQKGPH